MESLYEELMICEDIIFFEDPGIFRKKYFITSNKRSTFLKVKKGEFNFLRKLSEYLNGNYSTKMIEKELTAYYEKEIHIDSAIEFLEKNRLMKHSQNLTINKIEVELSGKKVTEFMLEDVRTAVRNLLRMLLCILIVAFITIGTISIYMIIKNPEMISETYKASRDFTWSQVKYYEYGMFMVLCILAVLSHELGHMLVAICMGVNPKSINVTMIFGISPILYVRYKNLYTRSSLKRICVMSGGMLMNLLLGFIHWTLLVQTQYWIHAAVLIVNLGFILSALSLRGASDGYFIFSTLFNLEGFRWSMLRIIREAFLNKKAFLKIFRNKKAMIQLGYFIFSYSGILWTLYLYIHLIMDFIGIKLQLKTFSYVLCIGLIIIFLLSISKFIRNIKKVYS